MAEADWTVLTDSQATADIDRGVTAGVSKPNGGGTFVHGFNSLTVVTGGSGLFTNQTNFAPMAKGGRIQGAMKRHPGGGKTGFAPFLYIGLQGPSVNDLGYMLGLSDADPAKYILRKGKLSEGFPSEAVDPSGTGILAIGTKSISEGTWVHVRLDMIVNLNGDVVLNAFENADLATNDVTAPVFTPIAGMDTLNPSSGRAFLDDALGVNSGSQPFLLGRAGFGFFCNDVTLRSFLDHIEVARQL